MVIVEISLHCSSFLLCKVERAVNLGFHLQFMCLSVYLCIDQWRIVSLELNLAVIINSNYFSQFMN